MSPPASDPVLERLKALHPKAIDLSLGRMERLLAALGHPERRLAPVIHIAGTNGKGSVLAYLDAMLRAEGLRVQSYVSPHLVRFAERIRFGGEPIAEGDLVAALEHCERVNAGAPITFFEITTAAAFVAFAARPADVLILEVGLGGRLDATNVIARPMLGIITPVSIDHTHYLGDTLVLIAAEKAGILKPGVPAVIGPQAPEAMAVIEARAVALGAPLLRHGREWTAKRAGDLLMWDALGAHRAFPLPSLLGPHQIANAGMAIAGAKALTCFALSDKAIADGLIAARWPGRLQRLTRGPLRDALPAHVELWIDGGHNAAAGLALGRAAEAMFADRPLDLVVGMLNTKTVDGFLAPLAPHVRRLAAVAIPGEANSLPAEAVAAAAHGLGIAAGTAPSVAAALGRLADVSPSRILICGSLYLAGTVLAENG
ncbi:MAG: folylpolyglutamate synthase/dihydrofolate synthase family protein [Alphaproteobacteria bacterium]